MPTVARLVTPVRRMLRCPAFGPTGWGLPACVSVPIDFCGKAGQCNDNRGASLRAGFRLPPAAGRDPVFALRIRGPERAALRMTIQIQWLDWLLHADTARRPPSCRVRGKLPSRVIFFRVPIQGG